MGAVNVSPPNASICLGTVMHLRTRPARHRFVYSVFFLSLPLSRFDQSGNRWLGIDRPGLVSLNRRDYGPRDGSDLRAWVLAQLEHQGVTGIDWEIVLQTFPRILGYLFNPITLWFCHDRSGALRAVIAEVNNTFGERHNYLVAHADARAIGSDDVICARKVFHVSPFCAVRGHYRFRFRRDDQQLFAQIDYHDGELGVDRLLVTTLQGAPQPLSAARVLAAFLRFPLQSIGVIARIHWHALRLWLKRVPFHSKPLPPLQETSR